ncbi:hypothetical protein [Streptomyces sp. NPDC058964]
MRERSGTVCAADRHPAGDAGPADAMWDSSAGARSSDFPQPILRL